jgi:hypothetical protein
MPYTDADIQAFVIISIGDTPDGRLAANQEMVWAFYADKATVYPRLQQAYFTRACCDMVLGSLRAAVNISESGTAISDSQRFDHVQTLRANAQTEITKLERLAQHRRGVSGGRITQPAPISVADVIAEPIPAFLDANSPRLSGSPYGDTFRGID